MKSKYLARAFFIPLIIFSILGFAVSHGWISKSLYLPTMILVIVLLVNMNRKKNRKAHQNCMDIPDGKFADRLKQFEPLTKELETVGFECADKFYFESSPVVVVLLFSHCENGDQFIAYHFGTAVSYNCITQFENGYSLTTAERVASAVSPRAPKEFLCIEPTSSATELYTRHVAERSYLVESKLIPEPVAKVNLRNYFVNAMKKYYEHIASIPFFSIKMILWSIQNRGAVHLKSLEQQFRAGTITPLDAGKDNVINRV